MKLKVPLHCHLLQYLSHVNIDSIFGANDEDINKRKIPVQKGYLTLVWLVLLCDLFICSDEIPEQTKS